MADTADSAAPVAPQILEPNRHLGRVRLSPRQAQVLSLVVLGHTNAEIGEELGISVRTVRMHTDLLKKKFKVKRRRELIALRIHFGVERPQAA